MTPEQSLALQTLDASGCRRGVGFRQDDAVARAEAGVVNAEGEGRRLGVEAAHRRQRRRSVEQDAAETLGVALGDEAAL